MDAKTLPEWQAEMDKRTGLDRYHTWSGAPNWEGPWGTGGRWTWFFGYSWGVWRVAISIGDECEIRIGPFACGVWF